MQVVCGGCVVRSSTAQALLHGRDATASILIQKRLGDKLGEAAQGAELQIADASVARLDDGRVVSVANGETELEIRLPNQKIALDPDFR